MHEHQLTFTLFAWEICCLAVPKLYFVWTPYLCCVRNTSQFSAAGAWLEMWKWALHMWPWPGCCTSPWPAGAHAPGSALPSSPGWGARGECSCPRAGGACMAGEPLCWHLGLNTGWGDVGVPLLTSVLQELLGFVGTVLYPSALEHADEDKMIHKCGRVQKYWLVPFIIFLVSFPKWGSLVLCFAVYSCLFYRNVYYFSQLLQVITEDAILCLMSSWALNLKRKKKLPLSKY